MDAIFILGTAGSGKSLLTATLVSWFSDKGSRTISVNLDPGAVSLPYEPDVDIRNYLNLDELMEQYQLGPNGALVLASDLMASRLEELQEEIDEERASYAIVDTPGQTELFAYRPSGPFMVKNLRCDEKVVVYLFDPALVLTPLNFISVSLLASSLQLRLRCPQIPVLSKIDTVQDSVKPILRWSRELHAIEEALNQEASREHAIMLRSILDQLAKLGYSQGLFPVSAVTGEGMAELSAAITRILKRGEEVEA